MKALKITLISVAIAAIVALSILWISKSIKPIEPPLPPSNPFTNEINTLIDDSLSNMPAGAFCHSLYKNIQDRINIYYRDTMFSSNATDNERWRNNLQEKLYENYVVKFIEQAHHIFSKSSWDKQDRSFIAAEGRMLTASPYLEQGSKIALKLDTINKAIKKYNEIASFIALCENFSFEDYSLNTAYPEMSDKVDRANSYLNSNMDNLYVNRCTSLKDDLRCITETLFRKHADYLGIKISRYGDTYSQYSVRSDYQRVVYVPLYNQVQTLATNSAYSSISQSFKDRTVDNLNDRLEKFSSDALNYFSN